MIEPGGILTFTGGVFYPLNPRAEDVNPIDIAHSLSNQCRYTGHTKFHYSVATHTVLIYDYVKSLGYDQDVLTQVVIHDAGEAYLLDLAAPLKHHPEGFGDRFVEVEEAIEEVICERFNVERPFDPIVKQIDLQLRESEMNQLFPVTVERRHWGDDLFIRIPQWTPMEGKIQLERRMEECDLIWCGEKGTGSYRVKDLVAA